ncbi:MAG: LysR substrate-binding domain-containing protein [Candidatus Thiodiazotropha sp.]|nr:LysR family transcriptional regulator [Candidatus Thiodiazotropha taylori]MBT3060540.1 LysR family transcriptional regulator [Candidatus Thiodiazotropha sp. (ex Lucina pensylvanica)]MBV2093824.1 LysR family transcriptional regulator [Candidatus Thiodiazotropha sp. (ex Codakia orbicularis)]PUB72376.1 MAG: LysR family transcriptional regulator [gamma proteobacterium symbiont of Ctena orbiculata]MBT3063132.1 LysR family transcriptional regulator [Candidatus Thiodiazotropha sp. (ex Lucina pensyl
MNLRDLKYLIAVAETEHFGHAAAQCYISQPTLSGQIKKLEQELGVTIFERTNRSVSTTPIGLEIVKHAKLILEQADVIKQLAQAQRDPLAGALRVGAIPTVSPYLIPLILMPLKEQYPQMRLILSEEITDMLSQRLLDHQIDVAILATEVTEPELEVMPLFEEPFWLAHPRNHALYDKDEISRRDLSQINLLLLADGHCLTHQVMDVCRIKEGAIDNEMADLRAASLETLLQLVGAGFGCTLVPALAIRGSWTTDSGIIARKLHIKDAFRRVQFVYRKTFPRKKAIEVLAGVIQSQLPNIVRKL